MISILALVGAGLSFRHNLKIVYNVILGAALIGIISFSGATNPMLSIFGTSTYITSNITEYQPIDFNYFKPSWFVGGVAGVYILFNSIYGFRFGNSLIIAVLLFSVFQYGRMLSTFFIALGPLLAIELNQKKTLIAEVGFKTLVFIYVLLISVPLYEVYSMSTRPRSVELRPNKFPTELQRAIETLPERSKVLADYNFSSYVSFVNPGIRTLIDGRTNILHSAEDFQEYHEAMLNPDAFREVVHKYNIDTVIARIGQEDNNLALLAILSGEFSVRWLGEHSVGLSRQKPHLLTPTVLLYYPSCYKVLNGKDLKNDLSKLSLINPSSQILDLIQYLFHLQNPTHPKDDLHSKIREFGRNSTVLRIMALHAESAQNFKLAASILAQVNEKIVWDYLKFARYHLLMGDPTYASETLSYVPDLGRFSINQLEILKYLHESSRSLGGISYFPEERVQTLERLLTSPKNRFVEPSCESLVSRIRAL